MHLTEGPSVLGFVCRVFWERAGFYLTLFVDLFSRALVKRKIDKRD
jgi:hypothetical protein